MMPLSELDASRADLNSTTSKTYMSQCTSIDYLTAGEPFRGLVSELSTRFVQKVPRLTTVYEVDKYPD